MRTLSSTGSRKMLANASAAVVGTMTAASQLTLLSQPSRARLNENRLIATDGIDIREVRIGPEKGSGRELVFRAWDFAGQEVYYATHQFFLSKSRSLYLVLFNAAHVATDNNAVLPGMSVCSQILLALNSGSQVMCRSNVIVRRQHGEGRLVYCGVLAAVARGARRRASGDARWHAPGPDPGEGP